MNFVSSYSNDSAQNVFCKLSLILRLSRKSYKIGIRVEVKYWINNTKNAFCGEKNDPNIFKNT